MVGMELRQQLKLVQQLVMTPQLQQAIKLLQLSRTELVDMVDAGGRRFGADGSNLSADRPRGCERCE